MEAWAYGAQRILEDEGTAVAEQVRVGRQLVYIATLDVGGEIREMETLPAVLPSELRPSWEVACSDRDGNDCLAALLHIRRMLTHAAEAREGDEVLRRELGA